MRVAAEPGSPGSTCCRVRDVAFLARRPIHFSYRPSSVQRLKTSDPLVPPKPNEFDKA